MKRNTFLNNNAPCPFLGCTLDSELYGWIEITNTCNLKCPYCYADSTYNSNLLLPLVKIKKILQDFKKLNAKVVMISGGEPTTHPDIKEVLQFGANIGLKLVLISNGSFIDKELAQILSKNKIPIQLSIDSVSRKVYKSSRGVDLLPTILKNIDLLLKYKDIDIYLSATLTKLNKSNVRGLIAYAIEKGIQNVHIGELIPEGRSKKNHEIAVKSIYSIYKELYDLQVKNFLFVSIDMIEYYVYPLIFGFERHFHCNAMQGKTLEISSSGDVYFCGGVRDFQNSKIKFNVFKDNLINIHKKLTSNKSFQIPVSSISECENCQYANICAGGCRAIAYHSSSGNISSKSPFCKDIKKFIRYIENDIKSGRIDDYINFLSDNVNEKKLITKYF